MTASAVDTAGTTTAGKVEQGEVRRSARSGAIGLIGAAVSGLFGFVLAVVITRGYGAQGSGAIFAAIGILTVAGAVCALGADTGLIWAMPRRQTGPRGDAARLLPVSLTPPLLLSLVVAAVGVAAAPWLAGSILDGGGSEGVSLVRWTFAAVPFVVMMTVLLSAVRGVRSIGSYVAVQFFLLPIGRPLLVGAAALTGAGLVIGMGGWIAPMVAGIVLCVLLVRGPLGVGAGAQLRPTGADWRTFWGFALPRAASAAIDSSSMWVGVLMTATLASQQDAGVFGAVGRYILAGQLAMQGIRVAVAPQLSRLLGAGEVDAAAAVHRQTTTWVMILSWPLYLMLALFGPGFLSIFGSEFTGGAAALSVLAVAMLVNVGLGNVQTLLLMSGHSRLHLVATVAGLTTNVCAGLLLIPRHGVLGTAIAWSAGIVVENVISAVAARAVLHRPIFSSRMALTGAGLLAAVGAVGAASVLLAGRGVTGLVVALVLLAVGAVGLLGLRPVRKGLRGALGVLRGRSS